MQEGERLSLGAIRAFSEGSQALRFEANQRQELYAWVGRTLVEQQYGRLEREGKGLVRYYMAKMTGLSRAQVRGSWANIGRAAMWHRSGAQRVGTAAISLFTAIPARVARIERQS